MRTAVERSPLAMDASLSPIGHRTHTAAWLTLPGKALPRLVVPYVAERFRSPRPGLVREYWSSDQTWVSEVVAALARSGIGRRCGRHRVMDVPALVANSPL